MTSLYRILALVALVAIIFLTIGPVGIRAVSPMPVQLDRAAAFGVLAFLWVLAFPRNFIAVSVVIVLLAIGLEFAQELRPDRHGREGDALIKLAGAALGLGIGGLLRRPARQ